MDKQKPLMSWYQESGEGKILFVVFNSQKCQWARCNGCNLHHISSKEHIGFQDLIAQIDYLFDTEDIGSINKLIVSNNGSMLDEDTFSTTALMHLVKRLNVDFPNVKIISLETRIEYVDISELSLLHRTLLEGNSETELEIGIGFEAYDDEIRNTKFDKGLHKKHVIDLVSNLSKFGFHVKCYFMLKPVPGMSTEEAIADIHQAIRFLSILAEIYTTKINLHLNPTYVAKNTALVAPFESGEYLPPTMVDVAKSIKNGKELDNEFFSIYIGLSDEDLAVEGGSFRQENDDNVIGQLEEFNRTQNYDIIDSIIDAETLIYRTLGNRK